MAGKIEEARMLMADSPLGGEFFTANAAAVGKNGTTGTGGHAGPESMTAGADQAARLIGAFHRLNSGLYSLIVLITVIPRAVYRD